MDSKCSGWGKVEMRCGDAHLFPSDSHTASHALPKPLLPRKYTDVQASALWNLEVLDHERRCYREGMRHLFISRCGSKCIDRCGPHVERIDRRRDHRPHQVYDIPS
jgi:hypothetical protein